MLHKLKQRNEGFTIIEVLIVLAIAGLILLIVFLAVPALQRNSRNTTIRNDAASVLGGVNEYVANNSGQLPTAVTANTTTGDVTVGTGTGAVTVKVKPGTTVGASTAFPAGTGAINIAFNNKCNGNTAVTANTRSVSALYRVEGGTTTPTQCTES